jgi:hypothetical protein
VGEWNSAVVVGVYEAYGGGKHQRLHDHPRGCGPPFATAAETKRKNRDRKRKRYPLTAVRKLIIA